VVLFGGLKSVGASKQKNKLNMQSLQKLASQQNSELGEKCELRISSITFYLQKPPGYPNYDYWPLPPQQ